jgi:glutamine---fructose-6-phosphate transaminase (isomerizing)
MTHSPLGAHTRAELLSQPEAWRAGIADLRQQFDAIRGLWQAGAYAQIVVTGCGSPYYAALAAATYLRERGLTAVAAPASEVWLSPRAAYPAGKRTLLIVLSRSGETTELLRACNAFTQRGDGDILTITCYPQSSLARAGKLGLALAAGQEESFAQTRAFTLMLIAALSCGALWTGDTTLLSDLALLPEACQRALDTHGALAQARGADPAIDRYYFLGSSMRFGLANEISLKMKEMSISHSEPFHFLEFRHGPQTMVGGSTLVVGMIGEANTAQEQAVLSDMRALGGHTLSIGESGCDMTLASGLSDAARAPLYVVVGQLLALEHAVAKGLNADRPHNLHAVVKLGD